MRLLITTAAVIVTIALSATAQAFCGFYVAKADTSLFNRASQVVLVRDGDRTVLTMANDFEGDVEDFAMVIPVPTFIEREQINVADKSADRSSRCLHVTAPRRVLRPRPLPTPLQDGSAEECHARDSGCRHDGASANSLSASRSKRATRSASTTS